ncbi:hypothetical protein MAMC_01399 [Methylacidimicrobium cyclopophantes]|uniref:Uncharacterized protein n=1 Tax=Methylacidimicrobium cyclopophantes TaxID=1041766 RepID=A0A5E6MF71_9BACT|nr:hypothetical protein [Methylacidimicrobium cyclopophantes]VVM07016.1 hypothetical protein MAMC_01399 [Methylacidimicrobium cyclopophantes]
MAGLVAGLISLAGCVHQETVQVRHLTSARYLPSRYVQVYRKAPEGPYEKIAVLEATGQPDTPRSQLLGSIVEKARELGAEAVIVEDKSQPIGNPLVMNPTGGMYSVNPGMQMIPRFRATAIRFATEPSSSGE